MTDAQQLQLRILGDHLASRRDEILRAWQKAAAGDPRQTTAHSLTRGQFYDHIPLVLEAFEQKLRARPGSVAAHAADAAEKNGEVKHGLQRWQLGYRLLELMHEWGDLQRCVFGEIQNFAATHPEFDRESLTEATRQMIALTNEAICESAGQYEHMQRAEAAGRVSDLEHALASVNELERRRTALIHQAVHDLRSNVQSVNSAAEVLLSSDIKETDRVEFTALLQQGVQFVSTMLGELMELARLEAGQDRCLIAQFDVAPLLMELCDVSRPIAQERNLFLRANGLPLLRVDGDARKVRRIAQNLVVNALKYTLTGGVIVSWGEEKEIWWLMVKDTGPGMLGGPGAALVKGMKEATDSARESDENAAAAGGDAIHVLKPERNASPTLLPYHQQPGEGIGLSIVKRLCELLDASLELTSSAEQGSTFRVVFPKNYPTAAA